MMKNQILAQAKADAERKGLPFDLCIEDIRIPSYCPRLDLKLDPYAYRGSSRQPQIELIDARLGYVKGNVRIVSAQANMIKNTSSRVVTYLESHISKHNHLLTLIRTTGTVIVVGLQIYILTHLK